VSVSKHVAPRRQDRTPPEGGVNNARARADPRKVAPRGRSRGPGNSRHAGGARAHGMDWPQKSGPGWPLSRLPPGTGMPARHLRSRVIS